ncbi:Pentatricopeptide repeat-containing protein At1g09190 [Linum grandiflorum]
MNPSLREIERKVLRLLHSHKSWNHLRQIHARILRHGLNQCNQVLTHFVSVCGSLNRMQYSDRVFDQTHNPNIFLFNAMIKGYSVCGPFEESLHLFSWMKKECGIWADEYTFAPLLKACSSLGDLRFGQCVQKEVVARGFGGFSSIRIGVVEMYTTCGGMEDARKVFDEMLEREVIVWNLMIRGYCKRGDVDRGLCLFRSMNERSVVSWNIMISGLAQSGRDGEALGIFREMKDQDVKADEATLVTVLPISARLGDLGVGKWIHSYADSSGLYQKSVPVGNALVDFYSKSGDLDTATRIFNEMPHKNVVSWNAMISGLAFNGKGELGSELFEEMKNQGVCPNDATLIAVLSCCAHAGLVERGRVLFTSMIADHEIEPKLEHYGCLVDLLGRDGRVREAYDLVSNMPHTPTAALWGALLSACRNHGDLELAELVIKKLIALEPWNSGNYVLLSNIYAEEQRWDEVEKVRGLIRERSVKKAYGQSAIG